MSGLLPAIAPKRRLLRLVAAGAGGGLIGVIAWVTFTALRTTNQPPLASPSPEVPTSTSAIGPSPSLDLSPTASRSPTLTHSATPSDTATSTATLTRVPPTKTPTPSATVILDTAGPSINSVSDSPDPIYVTQPNGCSPNASVVSVSVSDPSGVASVVVLFFHTTIGAVPMTHTGGDNWQATLGPYTGVGDGTVDYQVRATDSQGNISESAFYQITVLACIP